ncbi:MAG: acyl-CoA dehydrogenase family protein, partial [Bradymonadaceae bacterium]
RENDRRGNHPSPDRYTDFGRRVEEIDHHPTYHRAGEYIYGSGIIAAYERHPNAVGALARFYLSSYNSEAGHNCPVACTAGVVRVLQELADDDLREAYLPGFLSPDYDEHLEGAQFLTEIQGGSDVGKNATRAERAEDGTYRIWGEKWFCSNVDADVFLMTARLEGGPEGTDGLGLFLVPRETEDGQVNAFEIRRLKDKIGTRAMASAECTFEGARAYHLGEEGEGFRNMMRYVINTSRLYNALACVGSARRAFVVAASYARFREAFGRPIVQYPLIRETLAEMKAEIDAALSGSLHMAWLQDEIDAGDADSDMEGFFRMALNLNKIRTAKLGRRAAVKGIEVLGGNGAIETFSVLPRLLRDSIVTENWEGTHNTLQMQIMRDMQKYAVHEGFMSYVRSLLETARDEDADLARRVRGALETEAADLAELATLDRGAATLKMRSSLDRLAWIAHAAVRIWERGRLETDADAADASLEHFVRTRVADDAEPTSEAYADRIETLARAI